MYLLSLALVFTFLSTASQVFTAPVPYKSIDTRSEGATLIPRDELSLLERDFSYEPLDTRSFDDAEFDERSLDFFDPVDFEERSLDIDDPYEFEKRFLVERAPLPEPGLESYEQMQKRGFFKKMFRKVVSGLPNFSCLIKDEGLTYHCRNMPSRKCPVRSRKWPTRSSMHGERSNTL